MLLTEVLLSMIYLNKVAHLILKDWFWKFNIVCPQLFIVTKFTARNVRQMHAATRTEDTSNWTPSPLLKIRCDVLLQMSYGQKQHTSCTTSHTI